LKNLGLEVSKVTGQSKMSESKWRLYLVVGCLLIALICYSLDYVIFRDSDTIIQFLLEETGFIFISVILVSLVIDKILAQREMSSRLEKLNMVIGAFFSEIGTELMGIVADFDANMPLLSQKLRIDQEWTDEDFRKASQLVKGHDANVSVPEGDLKKLKVLLHDNQDFLLALLQNPNLLEHESFTNLLWALFHASEELANRKDLDNLSNADKVHISGDIARVYKALVCEWLNYLSHLKEYYPFLYSFEMRTNPFNPCAKVEFSDTPEPVCEIQPPVG